MISIIIGATAGTIAVIALCCGCWVFAYSSGKSDGRAAERARWNGRLPELPPPPPVDWDKIVSEVMAQAPGASPGAIAWLTRVPGRIHRTLTAPNPRLEA